MWQGRAETAASLAARLRAFFTLGQSPPGRSWHCIVPPDYEVAEDDDSYVTEYCDLEANPAALDRHAESTVKRSVDRGNMPGSGYHTYLSAMRPDQIPRDDDPLIHYWMGDSTYNYISMDTDLRGVTDPLFVTYDVMRINVLAAAAAFSPEWCHVGPSRLSDYLDDEVYNRPCIPLAWMLWLCPAYAALVTPPSSSRQVIVEPMTDGSLFMATGRKTFDLNDPTDISRARAIHRQVDHINYTVPFNGLSGRSDRVPPFPKL